MEFHEKLQELRKQNGMTQEALAEALFVSRTAISKWESGRGYPNIDSLKAISKYFSVTIDELLSSEQALTIAEEENRQKHQHLLDLVFGLLDCGSAMFLFLPFFGQNTGGAMQSVSLLSLTQTETYLKTAFFIFVFGMILLGLLTLALQTCRQTIWMQRKSKLSIIWHMLGTLLFIVSKQPYAAAILFLFLAIKVIMFVKKQ